MRKRVRILKTLQRSPESLKAAKVSIHYVMMESGCRVREAAERDEREICGRWLLSGAVSRRRDHKDYGRLILQM